jgi:hypothetical protein
MSKRATSRHKNDRTRLKSTLVFLKRRNRNGLNTNTLKFSFNLLSG